MNERSIGANSFKVWKVIDSDGAFSYFKSVRAAVNST